MSLHRSPLSFFAKQVTEISRVRTSPYANYSRIWNVRRMCVGIELSGVAPVTEERNILYNGPPQGQAASDFRQAVFSPKAICLRTLPGGSGAETVEVALGSLYQTNNLAFVQLCCLYPVSFGYLPDLADIQDSLLLKITIT